MHKTYLSLQFYILYQIYSLGGQNRNKPAPGDHKSNFKKVGAIPSEPEQVVGANPPSISLYIYYHDITIYMKYEYNVMQYIYIDISYT